jgi:hypothetical protein
MKHPRVGRVVDYVPENRHRDEQQDDYDDHAKGQSETPAIEAPTSDGVADSSTSLNQSRANTQSKRRSSPARYYARHCQREQRQQPSVQVERTIDSVCMERGMGLLSKRVTEENSGPTESNERRWSGSVGSHGCSGGSHSPDHEGGDQSRTVGVEAHEHKRVIGGIQRTRGDGSHNNHRRHNRSGRKDGQAEPAHQPERRLRSAHRPDRAVSDRAAESRLRHDIAARRGSGRTPVLN